MSDKPKSTLKRVKTGAFERRFSMARAGFVAGTRLAAQSAGNMFSAKDQRAGKQKQILSKQAHYLADEIGKLKGSIVKIGQMMALYGEHFLSVEVTEALHTLEDDTAALEWATIHKELVQELGDDRLALLNIEETPLGAASIGQVHKATIISSGEQICLKVQYPGVAEAVDSDLSAVETLLRVMKLVPITEEFKAWFQEIREMMHREVDYDHEREKTKLFRERLKGDNRFVVPKVYDQFCSKRVVATAYEPGLNIDAADTKALSQQRRNQICSAALDLCWKEVFEWGEMQTDPNFGNYFVQLGNGIDEIDKIVLLDFGAVREFSDHTLIPGRKIVAAAYLHDDKMLLEAMDQLNLFRPNTPDDARRGLLKLCYMAIEPFADAERFPPPSYLLNDKNEYIWGDSNLPARLSMQAGLSAAGSNRHFTMPPRELMFLVRKIMGAYTFMSVLKAEIRGSDILAPYVAEPALSE